MVNRGLQSVSGMRNKSAHQIVAEKRQWHHQVSREERKSGFKGWYSRAYLPHFDAPGVQQFVTYRLADSTPAEVQREWQEAMALDDDREKFRRMERMLDRGLGGCALKRAEIAQLVQENLWFHDGKAYRLLAWVIMPNHVHILAEMWKPLAVVLKNWKSYTAGRANKLLGRVGESFWQPDYFDRYIRDQDHYRRVVNYIEILSKRASCVNHEIGLGVAVGIAGCMDRMNYQSFLIDRRSSAYRSADSPVRECPCENPTMPKAPNIERIRLFIPLPPASSNEDPNYSENRFRANCSTQKPKRGKILADRAVRAPAYS